MVLVLLLCRVPTSPRQGCCHDAWCESGTPLLNGLQINDATPPSGPRPAMPKAHHPAPSLRSWTGWEGWSLAGHAP